MYREFYKLGGKPFQLTPDLRYLYRSAGHRRALSYLNYGLEQGEGFVVITGHIGTGKTMLIQSLLSQLSDRDVATARIAAANLNADNLVPTVAAALGQSHEGKSKVALLRDLEKSLVRARDYLSGVLLIVDEAQTLDAGALEELRILSNLEVNGSALLQIFLIGQTELRDLLRQPKMEHFRQRTLASYHLKPLTVDELKRYVGFRLAAAGWSGDPVFSPDLYKEAHAWTEGIPRKINILMDRMLVYGYLEELHELSADDVGRVMEEMSLELAGDLVAPPAPTRLRPANPEAPIPGPESGGAPVPREQLEARLAALEARLDNLSRVEGGAAPKSATGK